MINNTNYNNSFKKKLSSINNLYIFKLFILIFFLLSINQSYSQGYIGKNIEIVKKQIKQDLIKNGFSIGKEGNYHYYKQNEKTGEWDIPGDDFYQILLQQEVEVKISWNRFMNVINVSVFSNNENEIKKIKKIFNPDKWKYIETKYDEKYYLYNGSIITIGGPFSNYQYGIQNYIKT